MKNYKKNIILVFLVFLFSLLITINIDINFSKKHRFKNFIIENKDKIKYIEIGDYSHYSIDSLSGYYNVVSIHLTSDSTYKIIFWGDRNSWLWDYKLDYYFTEDIPYNRSKRKNVEKDVEIINILKNIK